MSVAYFEVSFFPSSCLPLLVEVYGVADAKEKDKIEVKKFYLKRNGNTFSFQMR